MAGRKKEKKTVIRNGKQIKLVRFEGDTNWSYDKD
jgi:hypothetical protein